MINITNHAVHLGIEGIIVHRIESDVSRTFDCHRGKNNASFSYIRSGQIEMFESGRCLTVRAGDCVFHPRGIRYSSLSTGMPDARHISVDFIEPPDCREISGKFGMQIVPALSVPATGEFFERLYELTAEKETQLEALLAFASILPDYVKLLEVPRVAVYSPAVTAAMQYIEEHYRENDLIEALCRATFLSQSRLYHLFRSELSTTPVHYRNRVRIEKAVLSLRDTDLPAERIAADCGFESYGYFRQVFHEITSLTPGGYRKQIRENNSHVNKQKSAPVL